MSELSKTSSCCGFVSKDACIRIRKEFPTYVHEKESEDFAGTSCPWHDVIRCKYGTIGPSGGRLLWASIDRRPHLYKWADVRQLCERSENTLTLKQFGDDGMSIEFHQDDFDVIAKVIQPERRKR